MGREGRDGERDLPGALGHRYEQTVAQRSGQIPRLRLQDSYGTMGRVTRDCWRGGLSGFRRLRVHDWQRVVYRWRMDGSMKTLRDGEHELLVYTQVFAPEAQRKLAGGGAKRNHRSRTKPIWRPGWDAGPRPASMPMPVLRPIRGAPASVAEFPVVTLRGSGANLIIK